MSKAREYLGGKCILCGSGDSLEIDHIDWRTKLHTISSYTNRSWEIFLEELKKCQLLCSECHKDKTRKDLCEQKTGERVQPHGTQWKYVKYGCRCDECVLANKEYNRIKKMKLFPGRVKRKQRVCGTNAMYKFGCRCDECRKASAAYMRDYNLKKKLSENCEVESLA
mgnify:FL=1